MKAGSSWTAYFTFRPLFPAIMYHVEPNIVQSKQKQRRITNVPWLTDSKISIKISQLTNRKKSVPSAVTQNITIFMRPSSVGGGRILRRTLSVCLSVCPSVPFAEVVLLFLFTFFTVEPSYERTSKIEKLLFSLMGQRNVCNFRHA